MSILLLASMKGGVAKTTTAVALAEFWAAKGERVLLIDADHQCSASELLLGEDRAVKADARQRTLHDLCSAMLKPDFQPSPSLFNYYEQPEASNIGGGLETMSVLPCSVRINDFQSNYAKGGHGFKTTAEFNRMFGRHARSWKRYLNGHYDRVIVDCPPSLAIQVRFLVNICDGIIIPTQPNRMALRGAAYLVDRIRKAGFKKQFLGLIWSMYRAQDARHRQMVENPVFPSDHPMPMPFETVVGLKADIAKTADDLDRQPPTFKSKYAAGAGCFGDLAVEIMERLVDIDHSISVDQTKTSRWNRNPSTINSEA